MNQKAFVFVALLAMIVGWTACRLSGKTGLPPGDADNGGLVMNPGFEAVVLVDSLQGAARHIAVNDNGDLYVKLRFPQEDGGNAAIRDNDNDGKADEVVRFGEYEDKTSYGTAMRVHKGYLYFSSVTRVFRQRLTGDLVPTSEIETIVIDTQPPLQHDAKPIAFDNEGHIYVPFGAPSDCCQVSDRAPGSPGMFPCTLLDLRGGIWQFDENKAGQYQKDGVKYATGLRSVVALAWNEQDNNLFTAAHGRDYLHPTWPKIFTEWQGSVLPSEEFLRLKPGAKVGWPYYYYDQIQKKKFLNPEYGGDGKKQGGADTVTQPVMGFPGHFAPNDLLFYKGNQFPARYKQGAFIAFHGSTSSAPYAQAGYFIAFVPFKNGSPSGDWEVFADGFAGIDTVRNVSDAKYRPMGLAEGPDGSLYVAETEKGKIWRIMYKGDSTFGEAQLTAMAKRKLTAPNTKQPDEVKDNLDPGFSTPEAASYNIYCGVCHQRNGMGDGRFPPLVESEWVKGDPTVAINIVLRGMDGNITVKGKTYNNRMPGWGWLSDEVIAETLTYVRTHFNNESAVTPAQVAEARQKLKKK